MALLLRLARLQHQMQRQHRCLGRGLRNADVRYVRGNDAQRHGGRVGGLVGEDVAAQRRRLLEGDIELRLRDDLERILDEDRHLDFRHRPRGLDRYRDVAHLVVGGVLDVVLVDARLQVGVDGDLERHAALLAFASQFAITCMKSLS